MKGLVFTELLAMADDALGEDVVDGVLSALPLDSGGAYTAVGVYPCSELVQIVGALSERTGTSVPELQRAFGGWMLRYFVKHYPDVFAESQCALDLLERVDGEVHVEVRKLYPDAELPSFDTERVQPGHLRMTYRSARPLVPFCHGLIDACVTHYNQQAEIKCRPLSSNEALFDIQVRG